MRLENAAGEILIRQRLHVPRLLSEEFPVQLPRLFAVVNG